MDPDGRNRRDVSLVELPAGSAVEAYRTGGRDDGKLLGFAIRFGGSWDAWVVRRYDEGGGRMDRVAWGRGREEAIGALMREV